MAKNTGSLDMKYLRMRCYPVTFTGMFQASTSCYLQLVRWTIARTVSPWHSDAVRLRLRSASGRTAVIVHVSLVVSVV